MHSDGTECQYAVIGSHPTHDGVQGFVKRFTEQQAVWQAAAAAMAELDVLMAFAEAAQGTGDGPMCRPHFLEEDATPVCLCLTSCP